MTSTVSFLINYYISIIEIQQMSVLAVILYDHVQNFKNCFIFRLNILISLSPTVIAHFHMMSRQPYWCSKTKKQWPYFMQKLSLFW